MSCPEPQPNKIGYSTEDIYREHKEFIRKIISCQVKDKHEADDVFQEFLLHITKSPPPQDVKDMEGFLYRAISNFIGGMGRKKKRYKVFLTDYADYKAASCENINAPEKSLIDVEEAEKMNDMIEELLPPREATAIIEKFKNNRGIAEIAEILGVSKQTVSHYILRAKRRIRNASRYSKGDSL